MLISARTVSSWRVNKPHKWVVMLPVVTGVGVWSLVGAFLWVVVDGFVGSGMVGLVMLNQGLNHAMAVGACSSISIGKIV